MVRQIIFVMAALCLGILYCCKENRDPYLFEQLDYRNTGIDFVNSITIDDQINIIDFQYCYNGGGVGIGDFNNDGLPDLLFTGNQVSSKIYLNKGQMTFEDTTAKSGVQTNVWVTGVSIIDINADGWDDIYLNVGGADCKGNCQNILFINEGVDEKGVPSFKNQAKEYGLDDAEYSQQSVFFDYDLDGDLDAYVLRNGNVHFDKNSPMPKRYFPEHLTDVLLRNDFSETLGHPYFTNVSEEMGITEKGFGLGLGINDFNNDGLPDIYVANDFITNDLLYLNNTSKDSLGTKFQEAAAHYFSHQTYNAMGVDIADLNNDTRPDVLVLDMLPHDYKRQKKMIGAMNYDKYELSLKNGYSPQYMRNTLHVNNGFLAGKPIKFSEVAFLSKIAQTDWSWAPLLADFDSDGDKDIFITNGYGKDITDLDFINYTQQNNVFGTDATRDTKLKELVNGLPEVKLQNFFFENKGGLQFKDVSKEWAKELPSLSNGVAYADLDLDGDLDLVVNNLDQRAFILQNNISTTKEHNYLRIKLTGNRENKNGIGAKVTLWTEGEAQTHFQSVVRGYLSSMEPTMFFGLKKSKIDSLQVVWPTGQISKLKNVMSNQTLNIALENAGEKRITKKEYSPSFFTNMDHLIPFVHSENLSNDYSYQQLLSTQRSKTGPCLASATISYYTGDVMFIGGSHGVPSTLLAQNEDGTYRTIQELDSIYEDTDASFFDFDSDGNLDLLVTSGGGEHKAGSTIYEDRVYHNNGRGVFIRDSTSLPTFYSNTSCVKPWDFDKDGHIDVFLGADIVPRKYPSSEKSRILINDNGSFVEKEMEALNDLGIVTDAIWNDIDKDGWDDLIVVGDWMSITVLKNHSGELKKMQVSFKDEDNRELLTHGWWKSIASGDFDNDGDVDFLVGNQGMNNFIDPDQKHPQYIYNNDFNGDGSLDPLIGAYYQTPQGIKLMPLHSRDDIMKQLVELKDRYPSYEEFTSADFRTLLRIEDLSRTTLKSHISSSVHLENLGQGSFQVKRLPWACQLGPINTFLIKDFDGDGYLDALAAGNDFQSETHFGRYDAVTGVFLKGTETGFKVIPTDKSGFYLPGQTNNIIGMKDGNDDYLIFAGQNNDQIKGFQWKNKNNDE